MRALADPDGLLADGACPQPLPWQEPDGGFDEAAGPLAGQGRVDLHAEIDTTGRTEDRRGDFDSVYGDWEAVAAATERIGTSAVPQRLDASVAAALRRAQADPGGLSDDDYLALVTADGPDLEAVCALADDLRAAAVGDDATYVVNRNINFSNVCYVGCRFCAFAQRAQDADAYRLSWSSCPSGPRRRRPSAPPSCACRAASTPARPAFLHPDRPGRARRRPGIHVHAFSPWRSSPPPRRPVYPWPTGSPR